jgi:hypothetical protein
MRESVGRQLYIFVLQYRLYSVSEFGRLCSRNCFSRREGIPCSLCVLWMTQLLQMGEYVSIRNEWLGVERSSLKCAAW